MRSINIATRKRPVDPDDIERMANGIVRRLETLGESDVTSTTIGELVMDGLSQLDPIAYVRFASVYRNFRETKDFEDFIDEIQSDRDSSLRPTPHGCGAGTGTARSWAGLA